MSKDQTTYCICQTELKRLDPVRNFAALTVAETKRADYIALQAFLAEIVSIPERITEPTMGEIRLQWWLDILENSDNAYASTPQDVGPLAEAIKICQDRHALPRSAFRQLLEARQFDFYNDPMPDIETYETYVGEIEAVPVMLALQILQSKTERGPIDSELCGHAAMAIGLSHHLFTWPKAATQRKLFLPLSTFEKGGLSLDKIYSRENETGIIKSITALCDLAMRHRDTAMQLLASLPKERKADIAPAFLLLGPAALKIKLRRKSPMKELHLPNWRAYWHVWRTAALL